MSSRQYELRRRGGPAGRPIPGGGSADAVLEGNSGRVAKLAPGLVNPMSIICAEQLHPQASEGGWSGPGRCESREAFGGVPGGVEGVVGEVEVRRLGVELVGDGVQELSLGERTVVGDVVGLTNCV